MLCEYSKCNEWAVNRLNVAGDGQAHYEGGGWEIDIAEESVIMYVYTLYALFIIQAVLLWLHKKRDAR
jgi:hypothetical protein